MIRPLGLLCIMLSMASCVSVQRDDYAVYKRTSDAITLPAKPVPVVFTNSQGIDFRGVVSNNDRVNSRQILYSGAGGVAGVVAQIAAHAAMIEKSQEQKLKKQHERANLTLKPLAKEIKVLKKLKLSKLSVPKRFFVMPNDAPPDLQSTYVETYPIFYVTENLKSLSVKNIVVLRRSGDTHDHPAYQNLVEVVSNRFVDKELKDGLTGNTLKTEVRNLYQASVLMALDDIEGKLTGEDQQPKTVRYEAGGKLQIERGVVVDKERSDIILRNLRGWLIRYPRRGQSRDRTIEAQLPKPVT